MTGIPVLDEPVKRLMELDQCSVFALADIAAERLRQIEGEGWKLRHDDEHADGALADAAACYAVAGRPRTDFTRLPLADVLRSYWPWDMEWWKPKAQHRNQVRAGALLVAELARHLRSAPSSSSDKR